MPLFLRDRQSRHPLASLMEVLLPHWPILSQYTAKELED